MSAMRLSPGSFPWLLAHDIRLGWRGAGAMFGATSAPIIAGIVLLGGLVLHALAWPAVHWLQPFVHDADASHAPLVTIVACAFTWMLSQSLFSTARTLYSRGDLDLLLGSPMPARYVFAAKSASIAMGTFGSIALLTLPLANVGAMTVGPVWLGIYPALLAMALIATALGLVLTIAMFSLVGPVRARLWTQMTGAVIAGAFVLGAQIAAMLPVAMRAAITNWFDALWQGHASGPLAFLLLPIDTVRGDVTAAAWLMAIALGLFALATTLLGQRFANASLAASGASAGAGFTRARAPAKFRRGLAANLRCKEWRLLARDPGMFAQLALQIIYTVPVAVVLMRNDALPAAFALAPTIVVIAAQVAASLAWITVSGEDAPELIATAPVEAAAVDRAKLFAVALPVLVILALPLTALALISLHSALVTAVIATAAGTSTALLNFWHPMPGNRRGMLRRHSQSKLMALVEHAIALVWAVAIVLAMVGSALVVIPVAIVVAVLACFRRK